MVLYRAVGANGGKLLDMVLVDAPIVVCCEVARLRVVVLAVLDRRVKLVRYSVDCARRIAVQSVPLSQQERA